MFDLITTLYAHDPLRYWLWDFAHLLGIADTIITLLHLAGYRIFEDYSVIKGN